MNMVDFHCHLDLYPNHLKMFQQIDATQILTLAVTTTPKAWPHNKELTSKSTFIKSALGLHPQLVSSRSEEIELWDQYFCQAQFIGEVGLDASPRFYRSLPQQRKIFEHILKRCAKSGDRVLSVHSVRSSREVLDCVEENLGGGKGKVVMHWFSGNSSELRKAIELGCYFSINEGMLTKPKNRTMLCAIPLDRILTESDGPFIQANGEPISPLNMDRVSKELSNLFNLSYTNMFELIYKNAKRLFD